MVATTEQQLLVAVLSSLLLLFLDAEQRCSFPSCPFFHVEFPHFPNHEVSLSCREWNLLSEVMKTCSEFLCLCGFVLGWFFCFHFFLFWCFVASLAEWFSVWRFWINGQMTASTKPPDVWLKNQKLGGQALTREATERFWLQSRRGS